MAVGTVALPFACGFEMGSGDLVNAAQQGTCVADATYAHTGTYSGQMRSGIAVKWKLSSTRADIYLSAWVRNGTDSNARIGVETTDGYIIHVQYSNSTNVVSAYVDGSVVAIGTVDVETNTWFHVEAYFSIANSGGQIKTWIEGLADIDYTEDTQPGTSDQIEYLHIGNSQNVSVWIDDFHANTSRIYDRRVLPAAVPNSDNTAQLTASSGGDNYADVDELGPDGDTTYVSTDVDAQKDLYGHSGVDLTGFASPYWVTLWGRPRKTVANGDQLRLVLSSSGTEETGSFEDLLTSYEGYMQKLWVNDPSTGAPWANEAAIDAALIGIEGNIP